MTIDVDGVAITMVDVTAVESTPATYEAKVTLKPGNSSSASAF